MPVPATAGPGLPTLPVLPPGLQPPPLPATSASSGTAKEKATLASAISKKAVTPAKASQSPLSARRRPVATENADKVADKLIDLTTEEPENVNNTATNVPMEEDSVEESKTLERDAGEHAHPPIGPARHKPSGTQAAQSNAPCAMNDEEPLPMHAPARVITAATAGHPGRVWVKCCAQEWMRPLLTAEMLADAADLAILEMLDITRPGGRVKNIEYMAPSRRSPARDGSSRTSRTTLKRNGAPLWIAFKWDGAAIAFVNGIDATLHVDMPGGKTGESHCSVDSQKDFYTHAPVVRGTPPIGS